MSNAPIPLERVDIGDALQVITYAGNDIVCLQLRPAREDLQSVTITIDREQTKQLWRTIEKYLHGDQARETPCTGYLLTICEGCGRADLKTAPDRELVAGSTNRPGKCACGSDTFRYSEQVARRKMVVQWRDRDGGWRP